MEGTTEVESDFKTSPEIRTTSEKSAYAAFAPLQNSTISCDDRFENVLL